MKKIAILGMGHIGNRLFSILSKNENFKVSCFDLLNGYDLSNEQIIENIVKEVDGVVASTPFFLNKKISSICSDNDKSYFDLTEDIDCLKHIQLLCQQRNNQSVMIPACGLAPGMISIIANHLVGMFDKVENVNLRVGALPAIPNNNLSYNITWSLDGWLNEIIQPCWVIDDNKLIKINSIEGLEKCNFNGIELEACSTSGGIGTLAESLFHKVNNLDYKTLRYSKHWEYMKFLSNDLKLKDNIDKFREIFKSSIQTTKDDRVFIFVKVIGYIDNVFTERNYFKIIECSKDETAIQKATCSGILCVLDLWSRDKIEKKGFVKQEELSYEEIKKSNYSVCYDLI